MVERPDGGFWERSRQALRRIAWSAVCLTALAAPSLALAGGAPGGGPDPLGSLSPLWLIPFAGLLLSIAIVPMIAGHWWHHNKNQLLVAVAWAAPVFGYLCYLIATGDDATSGSALVAIEHALEEYVSFIALLASLYIISGGILLKGDLEGKPSTNLAFLAIGAVISNVIGTTGASMLLIRPMLRTNAERSHTWHIPIFFIFLVSNIGGALTPIGDPPLFLGFLRGVSFFWTLEHLWYFWLPTVFIVLAMFYAIDTWLYRKEGKKERAEDIAQVEPLGFEGTFNFLLLGGVIVCILFLSPVSGHGEDHGFDPRDYYLREIGMAALAGLSLLLTSRSLRVRNGFNYGPILEVGALFIGIFVAMIPATKLLAANGASLGLTEPIQYFWATGGLSAFLDNAPTYVTFASVACGVDAAQFQSFVEMIQTGSDVSALPAYTFLTEADHAQIAEFIKQAGSGIDVAHAPEFETFKHHLESAIPHCTSEADLAPLSEGVNMPILQAIALGSVFLGAGSYIGNGPNFMVRAIADDSGYKMPSFFGYCFYAAVFLGPVFAVVSFVGLWLL